MTIVEANGAAAAQAATPEVGQELTTRGRTITESDLVSFSALTGDWHPQHADAEWAAGGRFGERVAHGMLVLSYAVGLVPFDPDHVVALRGIDSVRFKRPVGIGDTIHVRTRVERVRPLDDWHSLVDFRWSVMNQDERVVARASVEAIWRGDAAADEAAAEELDPLDGQVLL